MMPVRKFGKCNFCGRPGMVTFVMGWDPEGQRIVTGWVCEACSGELAEVRKRIREIRGGSESQEERAR